MLPPETRARVAAAAKPAIVEVAGRDSIAAAVRAAAEGGFDLFLPAIAYTGTEVGEWEVPFEKVRLLRRLVEARGAEVEVLAPVVLGAPALWHVLGGRYATALIKRFGFYTPCLGCHLYLHALRVPLARALGCANVVAGERERHDGRVKVNQLGVALDAYARLLADFAVELTLPLRHVAAGPEVEKLAGTDWREGAGQMFCVLRGNYKSPSGAVSYDELAVTRFFADFAVPVAARALHAYLEGRRPDYENLAEGLWPAT